MHLYIAYKNYSSWSLRPWLAMKVADIEFTETQLAFYHSDALKKLGEKHQVPAAVPILEDKGHIIWDSMAIMEYIAELAPQANLWPEHSQLRALARSCSAEMHSGFMSLRSQFPMNCRRHCKVEPNEGSAADLVRLAELWEKFNSPYFASVKPEGDFLCGHFSNVDAMFAPVMWRVKGYNLYVSEAFDKWADAMLGLPAMQDWLACAKSEEWTISQYDELTDI